MSVHHVVIRKQPIPADTIFMVRGGINSIGLEKLRGDASRSLDVIGVLGISVQSSLHGETLEQAWEGSRVLSGRRAVWWTDPGRLRRTSFTLAVVG